MAKLGAVPDDEYSKLFQVPGLVDNNGDALPGVVFDVFPGAPTIDDEGYIGTKGNYLKLDLGQTGVFYRKLTSGLDDLGTLHVIANSETSIPAPIQGSRTKTCYNDTFGLTTFGSTAPPSVAKGRMVFLGLDNETDPMCGGIYEAEMTGEDNPVLMTLVDLETAVPDESDEIFSQIGEVLSYDGNAVTFWGAWGNETREIKLCCPSSGNKDRRFFCLYNDTNTIGSEGALDDCDSGKYQEKMVPINQGFFVYNKDGGTINTIAKIVSDDMNDMLFWTYSGKPPNAGPSEGDGDSDAAEPPRWRSSTTAALSRFDRVVYKQMKGGEVGIWYWNGYVSEVIVKTGDACTDLDDDGVGLIESLAMERDGFRGPMLAIAAACAEELTDDVDSDDGDWGGIYLKQICSLDEE